MSKKLGIDKPLDYQCPKIDKLIKAAKEVEEGIRCAIKCDALKAKVQ